MRYTLHRNGFTLMEVVISIGIFSIATVIISSVYINANNLHQHTISSQRLQNEGRYIIEKIAREIRAREIQYSEVDGTQPQDHIEFLKDESGNQVSIDFSNSEINYVVNSQNALLNADDIEITDLRFYIIPNLEDKWNTEPSTNIQPRVVIFLKLKNQNINPKYIKEIGIQTTISSKVYKR